MERRNFLKNLGIGVATVAVPIKLAEEVFIGAPYLKDLEDITLDMSSLPSVSPEEILRLFQQTGVLYYKNDSQLINPTPIKFL